MTIEGYWRLDNVRVVKVNGALFGPERSQAVYNHSPDGFAWGYGGSGPAQLALALLLGAGVEEQRALRLHQRFKDEIIAPLPRSNFRIEIDPQAWADKIDSGDALEDL